MEVSPGSSRGGVDGYEHGAGLGQPVLLGREHCEHLVVAGLTGHEPNAADGRDGAVPAKVLDDDPVGVAGPVREDEADPALSLIGTRPIDRTPIAGCCPCCSG